VGCVCNFNGVSRQHGARAADLNRQTAALGVWGTATAWPDLAVAALMAGLFLTSSVHILRQAWAEYLPGSSMHPASAASR
jgi:Co/Zn/Cd efflux system component